MSAGLWRPSDVAAALRQGKTLGERGQRPWGVPRRPWVMGQTWDDLLFAHWRVPEEQLRRVVPPQIPIDTFDGSAWIGVTPFVVIGLHGRLMLPVPGTARFPEINVRTYATIDGRPGIWFISLDTPNRPAVATARRVYRLPYFRSRIDVRRDDGRVRFGSERVSDDGPPAACELEYAPAGGTYNAAPGSFEEFACERYCLYTLDEDERVLRGDIHHPPWPLQPAEVRVGENTMARQVGIELEGDPVAHFARRQDVVFWLNEPV